MDFGPEISTYKNKTVGVYGGKFYPFHQGHLSFIHRARLMVDVLFVVVQHDEEHEKLLLNDESAFEWISHEIREAWISQALKDFSDVRVCSHYEHRSENYMNDDSLFSTYAELKTMVGGKIDVVFSATHDYDAYFSKYLPYSKHVVLYEDDRPYDISATQIRQQGVYKHWNMLPKAVQAHYVKRVALCGIESSGKTYLSRALALHFHSDAVPEYGRLYYEKINAYTGVDKPEDYVNIAVGHCHLLNQAAEEAYQVLLVDTDLIYTQFFYEQAYGVKHPVLDALIRAKADKIDRWIWLEPHNPHELDGTRLAISDDERQKNRDALYNLYNYYGAPLTVIDEIDPNVRFQKITAAVDDILS